MSIEPVRWGVLGVADIAVHKVIPAMQSSELSRVVGIASRSSRRAEEAAAGLGIAQAFGSYEDLLADPDIEAVYIPLPNHLHAEWTIHAARAGKHVLCEKPLATTSAEARRMVEGCRAAGVKLMEAFMYRHHPLWVEVARLVADGAVGDLVGIQTVFSYRNLDPANIRNQVETGGGALYDIGCYPINVARMLFGREPRSVKATIRRDPELGTDVLTSAVLDFGVGQSVFSCSTIAEPDQRVQIQGTAGRMVVEIPFNIPGDRPTRLFLYSGGDPPVSPGVVVREIPAADQYGLQADAFSQAIRTDKPVPFGPEDAVANLVVIERIFADAR